MEIKSTSLETCQDLIQLCQELAKDAKIMTNSNYHIRRMKMAYWMNKYSVLSKLPTSTACHNCRYVLASDDIRFTCTHHFELKSPNYCRSCRPFFLAYYGPHRYMCFDCIQTNQTCHRYKKCLLQHWNQTVGKILKTYLCVDVLHIVWRFVVH